MKNDFVEYLRTLDWYAPAVDLIDAVTDWLQENRPEMSYEACAEMADRVALARLR